MTLITFIRISSYYKSGDKKINIYSYAGSQVEAFAAGNTTKYNFIPIGRTYPDFADIVRGTPGSEFEAVKWCYRRGFFSGSRENSNPPYFNTPTILGTANLEEAITREAFVTVLVRAIGVDLTGKYDNVDNISRYKPFWHRTLPVGAGPSSDEAQKAYCWCFDNGLFDGLEAREYAYDGIEIDGVVNKCTSKIQRQVVAQIMYNYIKKYGGYELNELPGWDQETALSSLVNNSTFLDCGTRDSTKWYLLFAKDVEEGKLPDSNKRVACQYCLEIGIITGYKQAEESYGPTQPFTRLHIASMLCRADRQGYFNLIPNAISDTQS